LHVINISANDEKIVEHIYNIMGGIRNLFPIKDNVMEV